MEKRKLFARYYKCLERIKFPNDVGDTMDKLDTCCKTAGLHEELAIIVSFLGLRIEELQSGRKISNKA